MRRIDDDRVVGFAIDEAGDRCAVGPVDHCRAIAEAVGRRVGDLVGPSLRRGDGRRGGESERGTGNGRERFVAGVGAEFIETRRRNVDRRSTKGGGQLDCLGIDQLDVIHSPRLKPADCLAAIGGVDDLLAIDKPVFLGELELVGIVLIDRGRGGIKRDLPGGIEELKTLAAPCSGGGERNSDAGHRVIKRYGQLDYATVDRDHVIRHPGGEPADRGATAGAVDDAVSEFEAVVGRQRDRVAGDRHTRGGNRSRRAEHRAL